MRYIQAVGGPCKRDRFPFTNNSTNQHEDQTDAVDMKTKSLKGESPPKRMKTESGQESPSHDTEEINSASILDTSQMSFESKDPSIISNLTLESSSGEQRSKTECIVKAVVPIDPNHVKNLRGWLDDFGRQNQNHFVKSTKPSLSTELVKPVMRPTVRRSVNTSTKLCPTPLPTIAANAFAKRMSMDKMTQKKVVRLVPKPAQTDVQATNEGYASVAELSKWLADDPTSTKKIKQIRRGANIIAKSRKFDKCLQDAIIMEKCQVERGSVKEKTIWLQKALSEDSEDAVTTMVKPNHSNDAMSVSEKTKWLSGAFASGGSSSTTTKPNKHIGVPERKVSTNINVHHNNDVFIQVKDSKQQQNTAFLSSEENHLDEKIECMDFVVEKIGCLPEVVDDMISDSKSVASSIGLPDSAPTFDTDCSMQMNDDDIGNADEVDYRKARELLVQRSKANGNDVEIINKVNRRKALFETMEQKARRKSMAPEILKPSWEEKSSSSGSYHKVYHPDIAPKKSLEDLP